MCGIFAVHGLQKPAVHRSKFIALSKKQRHRGPDWSGCYVGKSSVLVHERLAIVGVGEFCLSSDVVPIDGGFSFRYWCATTDKRRWEAYPRREWRDLQSRQTARRW